MCNPACLAFGRDHLSRGDVSGKRVIDVGARDINGSLRATVEALEPAAYLGVDLEAGPGVDEVCAIEHLEARFGAETFDVVLTTEVHEPVRPWRQAISNLKRILKPGGILLVTTRSKGFPYHGYPYDFWRYDPEDVEAIFADMDMLVVERDPVSPGIFVKARKPASFSERPLDDVRLYSIVKRRRSLDVTDFNVFVRRCKRAARLTAIRLGLWS
jgi:SAM-dependent methyltransferase